MKRIGLCFLILGVLILAACGDDEKEKAPALDPLAITAENAAQLVELITIDPESDGAGFGYAVSPDGASVAITTPNGLRIFDLASGTPGDYLITERSFSPTYIADGSILAVATDDGISLIDLATNTVKATYFAGESVNSPAISTDGTLVAAHSVSCSPGWCTTLIQAIDVNTGEKILSLDIEGYVDALVFRPNQSVLAFGIGRTSSAILGTQRGTDLGPGLLRLVDVRTGEDQLVLEHDEAVYGGIYFSADGNRVAYNTMDWSNMNPSPGSGQLHIYDLEKGEEVIATTVGGLTSTLSPDWTMTHTEKTIMWGSTISFSMNNDEPSVTVIETGEGVAALGDVSRAAFGPDSSVVAVTTSDPPAVLLYALPAGDEIVTFPLENADNMYALRFSEDGKRLALRWWNDEAQYLTVWSLPSE
ncbi:MAG: WD40 repeat domain-containing protein [Anaerolineae bacterium]|nr:WD40 repeat domain-containing protein [Anaerolineae bacterium]